VTHSRGWSFIVIVTLVTVIIDITKCLLCEGKMQFDVTSSADVYIAAYSEAVGNVSCQENPNVA